MTRSLIAISGAGGRSARTGANGGAAGLGTAAVYSLNAPPASCPIGQGPLRDGDAWRCGFSLGSVFGIPARLVPLDLFKRDMVGGLYGAAFCAAVWGGLAYLIFGSKGR